MKHRRGPAALGLALALAMAGCDNGLNLPVLTITQTWSVEGDDTRSFSFQSDDDGKIAGSFTGQEDRGAESAALSGSWAEGTVTFTVNWTVPVEFSAEFSSDNPTSLTIVSDQETLRITQG